MRVRCYGSIFDFHSKGAGSTPATRSGTMHGPLQGIMHPNGGMVDATNAPQEQPVLGVRIPLRL